MVKKGFGRNTKHRSSRIKPSPSRLAMCHMGQTTRRLSLLKVCALTTVGGGMVQGLSRILQGNDRCARLELVPIHLETGYLSRPVYVQYSFPFSLSYEEMSFSALSQLRRINSSHFAALQKPRLKIRITFLVACSGGYKGEGVIISVIVRVTQLATILLPNW